MGCDCGKPKCDGHCGVSPAVLQINNPSECVLFRKVEVPASMGTSVENPPKPGAYRNVLLYYNADGEAYLYSSDGMPTKVTGTTSNYEILTNKPKINGVELVGNKSLADIGVTNAINNALQPYTPRSELAEVAFTGDYNDLENTPPETFARFYMWPPSEGNAAPMYHDYGRTDQVTLAQFTDAIASGPVQIYMEHDGHTFWIYYVDQLDAFIPDPPMVIGTLDVSFGLRSQNDLGVRRFYWQEGDTAPIYDSYDPNQSDWNQTSSTRSSYIKNKPNLATVATSGSYNDLSNKPTIPAAQVNSDWNASSGVAQILNKPSLATVATSGSYNDLTDKPADFELVEMSYGESNAWAKFITAYQGHKIVYCRVSSNSDPSTGTQGRKAFMAYVNNATNPTEVEFQYVRSVASKTASQPVDQVFVYKLTNASGGTWTVETRNMAPKLAAGTNATVSYSNGTYTVGATVPTKTSDLTNDGATGTSVYVEESDITPSELSGEGEFVTLEGTTDCSALDIQLLGNAEQTTYSGKNLLPPPDDFAQTVSGVTVKCENGAYTFSGTATANGSTTARATVAQYTIQSGDYFHYDNTLVSDQINIQIVFTDATYFATSMNAANRIVSLESYVGKTITSCRVNFASGSTFNDAAAPMILHNVSTVADYEPYVGGIPAPNPQFPMPISTVTGAQTVRVTGKNLLDITQSSVINQGTYVSGANTSTYTIKATGNDIFVNAVGVAGSTWSSPEGNLIPCNYGETIYFNVGNNNFQKNYFTEWDENLVSLGYTLVSSSSGTYTPTNQSCKYVNFRFGNGRSVADTIYTLSPIVCKTSNIAYEPYQGQSYEINLGKNLLGGYTYQYGASGATATYNEDGTLTMTGTATAMTWSTGTDFAFTRGWGVTLPAGTYTFTAIGGHEAQLVSVLTDGTGEVANAVITTGDGSATFTTTAERFFYARLRVLAGATDYTCKFMLERGSQATSYAPYFTPIELAKIGTYQDRIYKDDGKWYIEKNVGKLVFDSTNASSIMQNPSNPNRYLNPSGSTIFTGLALSLPSFQSYCSHYTFVRNGTAWQGIGKCGFDPTGTFWLMDSTTSPSTLRAWLASEEVYIYYPLATPTTTEITDETLIRQLDGLANMLGYDGVTNIMSASPELPAILSVSTYTDSAIPSATRVRAGIVRIGDGIDVDDCGTISVNAQKTPTVITIDLGNQNDWSVVYNSLGPMLALGAGSVSSSQYDNRVRVVSLTPPTSTTFHNENTDIDMTLEEVFGLIESGEDVVFNNVPVGTYYDSRSEAYYPLGYAVNGVRVSDKLNYSDGAAFTGHVAINVPSPQSLDTQWDYNYPIVASISIRKLVVINGDISTTSYYLDVDGIYDGIVAD